MDPDANYREQELIYLRIKSGTAHPDDHSRLKALVAALRGWVNNGGFKPRGYVGPAWKPAGAKTSTKKYRCTVCGKKLDTRESHYKLRDSSRKCSAHWTDIAEVK